jgi:hypothetical protein
MDSFHHKNKLFCPNRRRIPIAKYRYYLVGKMETIILQGLKKQREF